MSVCKQWYQGNCLLLKNRSLRQKNARHPCLVWQFLCAGYAFKFCPERERSLSAEIRRRACLQSLWSAAAIAGIFWFLLLDRTNIGNCLTWNSHSVTTWSQSRERTPLLSLQRLCSLSVVQILAVSALSKRRAQQCPTQRAPHLGTGILLKNMILSSLRMSSWWSLSAECC